MSIYIFFGTILILFSCIEIFSEKFHRDSSRKIFYLLITLMGLALMTRWFVGWDWYNYYPHFQGKPQDFEKGYEFFVKVTKNFTDEYQIFVALNTVIDCIFLLWVIPRYSTYPITTLMLYLGVNGLPLEVDIMRNVKSIMLFLISIEFIEKRKIWIFLGLNLLGSIFHISSLIYLPLYFILNVKYKKRVIMGIFILGNLYYFSNLKLIVEILQQLPFERFQGYLEFTEKNRGSLNIFYLERVLIFLFAFFSGEMVDRKKSGNYEIFRNGVYITVYTFLYFRELPIISLRIFLLFSFSYWYIFPVFLESVDRSMAKNIVLKIGVFLLVVSIGFFRTYNFLSFPGNRLVYNYENYFFNKTPRENKIRVLKEGVKYRDEGKKREIFLLY